jgi:hypothetical protein
LASRTTKSWQAVRRQEPVNERRVATFRRLMEAQERIAAARLRRGASRQAIDMALAASEQANGEREHDLYVSALEHYVAALGGRLEADQGELRAVFAEELIRLLPAPGG